MLEPESWLLSRYYLVRVNNSFPQGGRRNLNDQKP